VSAAAFGHLPILTWARAAGCPWDERTCEFAARCGRLDVLRWALDAGCPWNRNRCLKAAQGSSHGTVVEWIGGQPE
jgi:hypothetical protein